MKRYLSIILIAIFALTLTGCGKGTLLTCTKDNSEFTATFKKDKMTKLVYKEKFETEEEANQYASLMIAIMGNTSGMKTKADGKYIVITTTGKALRAEYDKVTKDDFKKDLEEDGYICK